MGNALGNTRMALDFSRSYWVTVYKITALALGADVRKIEDKSYPDGHDETTIKFLKAAIHSCQWRWMMEPISQMLCFSSLRQGKSLSLRLEEVTGSIISPRKILTRLLVNAFASPGWGSFGTKSHLLFAVLVKHCYPSVQGPSEPYRGFSRVTLSDGMLLKLINTVMFMTYSPLPRTDFFCTSNFHQSKTNFFTSRVSKKPFNKILECSNSFCNYQIQLNSNYPALVPLSFKGSNI